MQIQLKLFMRSHHPHEVCQMSLNWPESLALYMQSYTICIAQLGTEVKNLKLSCSQN